MNISKVVKIMSLSLEREGIVIVTKRLKCFDSLVCTSSSARLIANTHQLTGGVHGNILYWFKHY